jgi:hypothetical protein
LSYTTKVDAAVPDRAAESEDMCRIFKITYACGHRDDVEAPCEWRDEGIVDSRGISHPCESFKRNLADLGRLCLSCSPRPALPHIDNRQDPAGQDLIKLYSPKAERQSDQPMESDEMGTAAILVRNEAYLRKRARRALFIPTPTKSLRTPTAQELHIQFCVNEEFLTRRAKRNRLREHLDGKLEDYWVYCDAAQAHQDAQAVLENSVLTLDQGTFLPDPKVYVDAATQTAEVPTTDSASQTVAVQEHVADPSLHPENLESQVQSGAPSEESDNDFEEA